MLLKDSRPYMRENVIKNNFLVGLFIRDKSNGDIKKNTVSISFLFHLHISLCREICADQRVAVRCIYISFSARPGFSLLTRPLRSDSMRAGS